MAAPPKLDKVKTDLDDIPVALNAPNCGAVFPNLAPGALKKCNAGDVPFAPRRNWRENANECYVRGNYIIGGADQNPPDGQVPPFYQELPTNYTGAVIGQWATRPDDELPDLKVWIRPTNTLFASTLKTISEDILEAGIAVAIAPVACLADLLFGGSDCVSAAVHDSRDLDVIAIADTTVGLVELATVGQKTFTSEDFPVSSLGVTLPAYSHFANVKEDAANKAIPGNQFNSLPGFKEILGGAGPEAGIDTLDLAVIAGTAYLGATVQPYKSNAVSNYVPFADGQTRNVGDWIDPTLGNVEFEPVENLAAWGWNQFRVGDAQHAKGGARGLGWVMHAIGDAGQPHHTISALGWGHSLWEAYANYSWHDNFVEEDVNHYRDLAAILRYGFNWWKYLAPTQVNGITDLPVQNFIKDLARQTYQLPVSQIGAAFVPNVSSDIPRPSSVEEVNAIYFTQASAMKDLMERNIGATLAFLARASDIMPAATPSPCGCGTGSSRFGQDQFGAFYHSTQGGCVQCGTGDFQALPFWVDGECVAVCPPDQPTPSGGVCTTALSCSPLIPYVFNGQCVPGCPNNLVIVNNKFCQPGPCPANTQRIGQFCVSMKVGTSSACKSARTDSSSCSRDGDCCSGACDTLEHICRSRSGEPCAANSDCISGLCSNPGTSLGICQPGPSGATCTSGADCSNGERLPSGRCNGLPGDACNSDGECMSGSGCISEFGYCCTPNYASCQSDGPLCCNGTCVIDQPGTPGQCVPQ